MESWKIGDVAQLISEVENAPAGFLAAPLFHTAQLIRFPAQGVTSANGFCNTTRMSTEGLWNHDTKRLTITMPRKTQHNVIGSAGGGLRRRRAADTDLKSSIPICTLSVLMSAVIMDSGGTNFSTNAASINRWKSGKYSEITGNNTCPFVRSGYHRISPVGNSCNTPAHRSPRKSVSGRGEGAKYRAKHTDLLQYLPHCEPRGCFACDDLEDKGVYQLGSRGTAEEWGGRIGALRRSNTGGDGGDW
ncbi:hypothetical protein K438DRAFT_1769739 [Mycena galopus ATCC 62051]|nr:hypothetical protein K438DRAFT_1769739 [Mycena galopus ATCC 62051]